MSNRNGSPTRAADVDMGSEDEAKVQKSAQKLDDSMEDENDGKGQMRRNLK